MVQGAREIAGQQVGRAQSGSSNRLAKRFRFDVRLGARGDFFELPLLFATDDPGDARAPELGPRFGRGRKMLPLPILVPRPQRAQENSLEIAGTRSEERR